MDKVVQIMLPDLKESIEIDLLEMEKGFAVCQAEWQLVETGKMPKENKKHCRFRSCPYCYFNIGSINYPYDPDYKHLRDKAIKEQ